MNADKLKVPSPDEIRKEIASEQAIRQSFELAIANIVGAIRYKYVRAEKVDGDVVAKTPQMSPELAARVAEHVTRAGWTCKVSQLDTCLPTTEFLVYEPDRMKDGDKNE